MASHKKPIHSSVKTALGYSASMDDVDFLNDWKHRSRQVCKPCWELKYCPYGPFVEQSPLLPIKRSDAIDHNEYIKSILASGAWGTVEYLDDASINDLKNRIDEIESNPSLVANKVAQDMMMELITELATKEGKSLLEYLQAPTSNFERYKVPYPLGQAAPLIDDNIKERINSEIERLKEVLKTGIDDQRKPLDPARKKLFEEEVANFNPEGLPEEIPQILLDSQCKNFGHICPVVFVGESVTETAEKRRIGRYISFKTKVRVVRRDNYTCQECGKHLKDDEVEFDHIIPHAKGGSSEEHNIRLTCFDCNRGKSDSVDI